MGLAVQFLQSLWGSENVVDHLDRMFSLVQAGQVDFYFDAVGRPLGFAAWAFVSREVSAILIGAGPEHVPANGWIGGDHPWVTDFIARDGCLPAVLARLRDNTLANHDSVLYFRFKRRRRIVKQLTRADKTSFFRRPNPSQDQTTLSSNYAWIKGSESRLQKSLEIGRCLYALRVIDPQKHSPLWQSSYRLSEIVALRQYRIYTPSDDESEGLLTWAWLSEYTISRISEIPLHRVHTGEWNEGRVLTFCDVAMPQGVKVEMSVDIIRALFPTEITILLYIAPRDGESPRLIPVDRIQHAEEITNWMVSAGTSIKNATSC